MCEEGNWEPFAIGEKERGEPVHRCYYKCTAEGCRDIAVSFFTEQTIEVIDKEEKLFSDPSIIDKEEEE